MANTNIPRWTLASLSQLFKDTADSLSLHFFIEGIDEEEGDDFSQSSALFRMNGPDLRLGGGTETYRLEIQILLTILPQANQSAHIPYTWAGKFQEVMLGPLPIFKFGSGPEDDQSLIGCLIPDDSVLDYIKIANFGQLNKTARVQQIGILGRYVLEL